MSSNLVHAQNPLQESASLTTSSGQPRTIYLDVAGKLHSLYKMMLLSPPVGYQFVTSASNWDNISSAASNIDFLYSMQLNILAKLFPPNLFKAYLERFKKKPSEADLTYSVGHLVFRKEPWIVDLEFVTQLTGYSYYHFKRFRGLIERVLASECCKKIICWTEAGKKTVLLNMDSEKFGDKITVVPLSVPRKNFVKEHSEKNVVLLFVGSVNIPGEFEYKGGKEVLEAFSLLQKKYTNIELVIRSDIPAELKAKYTDKMKNVRLIEGIIPWDQLDHEFRDADIFLFPSHSTPGLAILDAMSYELPIVTTDVWANPEMVRDGKTGFVINKSEKVQYYAENFIPIWDYAQGSQFMKMIKNTDPKVVGELVEKTSTLIEDENLRWKMGRAGKEEIENGKYSLEKRNKKLEKLFDEAIGI